MKHKNFYLAGSLLVLIYGCFLIKKYNKNKKLDTSITNGDKITATSLSDAENKTSVQTTPVNEAEAKALGLEIESLRSDLDVTKQINKRQANNVIELKIQKLFEMGYNLLPDGNIEKK